MGNISGNELASLALGCFFVALALVLLYLLETDPTTPRRGLDSLDVPRPQPRPPDWDGRDPGPLNYDG